MFWFAVHHKQEVIMRSFALIKLLAVSLILGVAACKPMHRQEHTSEARFISSASLRNLKKLVKVIIPDDTRSGEKLYRRATASLSDNQFLNIAKMNIEQTDALIKFGNNETISIIKNLNDEQIDAIKNLSDEQLKIIRTMNSADFYEVHRLTPDEFNSMVAYLKRKGESHAVAVYGEHLIEVMRGLDSKQLLAPIRLLSSREINATIMKKMSVEQIEAIRSLSDEQAEVIEILRELKSFE